MTRRNGATLETLWDASVSCPPYIVAELSGNHNGCLERALALVDAAAECGVDAVKFQTYTADTITLDAPQDDFYVRKPGSVWDGRSLHSLYSEASTAWEWHGALALRALERGLEWFSSPFDFTAVDFLETLAPACYKIASPEIVDLPLIRHCAATGRPLVMSTGMSTEEEIREAVEAARASGCGRVLLLKCTTDYPASPADIHLRAMPALGKAFSCPYGLSDHTLGLGVASAAVALGARLVEKHLTLRRADGGPDAHFSLEPEEMRLLVQSCRDAHAALGHERLAPTEAERGFLRGRRSLYVCQDMEAGACFTAENVRSIRPGLGLAPKHLDAVLGARAACALPRGTALRWEHVQGAASKEGETS